MENQNLYGFNEQTPEKLGFSPLPFGKVSDVYLKKVAYEPAKEGSENMCLAFLFVNKQGQQVRHTEWPIDVEETKRRAVQDNKDPDKAVQKRARAQGVRIKHITTKVVPADQAKVAGVNTFSSYAKAVVGLFRNRLPAGPFRVKILPDNKGYAGFPPYTPFIEKQTDEPSTLSISAEEQRQIDMARTKQSQGTDNLSMPDDLPDDDGGPATPGQASPTPPPAAPDNSGNSASAGDLDDDLPF